METSRKYNNNPDSLIDSRKAWLAATVAVICLGMAFGAPLIAVVSLKVISEDLGGSRSVPALGSSLAWLGSALGGLLMGRLAERYGVRWTVLGGAASVCLGLIITTFGQPWHFFLGHGVFIGFFGIAGLNAPLYVYVSQWFVRRRGSALALLSSGNYIAGICWPVVFQHSVASFGWRTTMVTYGAIELVLVGVLATFFLPSSPAVHASSDGAKSAPGARGGRWLSPGAVFVLICAASFLCCVPMAMPQGHLVALCSDHGLSASVGAAMLSTLLAVAFASRQLWGLVADRIGGIRTALISSVMQAAAVSGYLFVTEQTGLFVVSIAFGLGFSALIPAYVLAVREIFPPQEAYWRVPLVLFMTGSGMAVGGWLAGWLYDRSGSYDLAFGSGVASNLLNLALLAILTMALYSWGRGGFKGSRSTAA